MDRQYDRSIMLCGNALVKTPPQNGIPLPPELLLHIMSFIPRSRLPTIASVSQTLRYAAETELWKELWLMEPLSYSTYNDESSSIRAFTQMRTRRAELRQVVHARIESILLAMMKRPEHMAAILTINARTHRYSTHHLVTILHFVRRHLTTLRVLCAGTNVEFSRWGPHESFYAKMSDFDPMGFPCLQHLELAPCHNASYHRILRFLTLTPNISTLKISARDALQEEIPIDPIEEPWPGLPILHKLVSMELYFPDDDGLPEICREVFRKTPNLGRLVIGDIWADLQEDGWSDEEQGEAEEQYAYFDELGRLPLLEYLDWRCGSFYAFQKHLKPGYFDFLKTLVVDGAILSEEAERIEAVNIPPLRQMTTLVIRIRHRLKALDLPANTDSEVLFRDMDDTFPLTSSTLAQLRSAPNLRTIRFSRDEETPVTLKLKPYDWVEHGVRGIEIVRTEYGSRTLIHVRTLSRSKRSSAYNLAAMSRALDGADDDEVDDEMFVLSDTLHWDHAVMYEDRLVPSEMMDTAFGYLGGASWRKGEYGREGLVPTETWEILERWMEGGDDDKKMLAGQ